MSAKAGFLLCALSLGLLPLASVAQDSLPEYRLGYARFTLDGDSANVSPVALRAALFQALVHHDAFVELERDQQKTLLEIISNEGGAPMIYDSTKVARLRKQVPTNAVLFGDIRHFSGEIWVDARIVMLETGVGEVSACIIVEDDELPRPSDYIRKMGELAQRMFTRLNGESLESVCAMPANLDEMAGSLAQDLGTSLHTSDGLLLIAPFTTHSTNKFSEFSIHFKDLLTGQIKSSTNLKIVSYIPQAKPKTTDVAIVYARESKASLVLTGTYTRDGNDRFRFLTTLRSVPDAHIVAAPQTRIHASELETTGHSLNPECDLEYWTLPCKPWVRPFKLQHYALPGLYPIREGRTKGWLWLSGTVVSAVGLAISIPSYHDARANRNAPGRSQAQVNHYDDLMDRWQVGIIVSGSAIAVSYLFNAILFKPKR